MFRLVQASQPGYAGTQVNKRTSESGGSAAVRLVWRVAAVSRLQPVAVSVVLFLLVAAVFWPATGYQFVNFDDPQYVTENTHVQAGLTRSSLQWALRSTETGNWHPLTWLSHLLDCQAFGMRPRGHHLTSVLLHAVNAVLLFVVLRIMTATTGPPMLAAGLWALHPLRVESVAWVAERKDVLSACLGLLALWAYARYAIRDRQPVPSGLGNSQAQNPESRERRLHSVQEATRTTSYLSRFAVAASPSTPHALCWYLLALLFFALSLLCKPMLVTLPLLLLLLDHWPLRRFSASRPGSRRTILARLVVEKAPFIGLALAASVVALLAQSAAQSLEDRFSLSSRLANAALACCRYLGQLFYPANLCVYYPHPGTWPSGQVVAAVSVLVAISVVVGALRRQKPYLAIGWFWFLGALVPVLGLVQIGGQAMADRYTYVPSMGLFILLAWAVPHLASRRGGLSIVWLPALVAMVACVVLTRQQLGFWRDSETLFRRALAVTEQNSLAHVNLGEALLGTKRYEEAIGHFRQALAIDPGSATAHYNLGVGRFRQGRVEDALSEFQTAVALNPAYQEAHYNLGVVLIRQGRLDEGIGQLQEAQRLSPEDVDVRNSLRMALALKGHSQKSPDSPKPQSEH